MVKLTRKLNTTSTFINLTDAYQIHDFNTDCQMLIDKTSRIVVFILVFVHKNIIAINHQIHLSTTVWNDFTLSFVLHDYYTVKCSCLIPVTSEATLNRNLD